MRGTIRFLRSALVPVVGCGMLSGLLVGCSGDKTTNPDAVSEKELKSPGSLAITDLGNGKVQLAWDAANNETDFDGYDVFGMKSAKGDGSDLGLTQGQALQFLDEDGNPKSGIADQLAKLDYDPTKGLESAGTPPAASSLKLDDSSGSGSSDSGSTTDTPDFQALPIYAVASDGKTPLLPTCKPGAETSGSSTCNMTTDADEGDSVGSPKAGGTNAANGTVTYTPTFSPNSTLTVGSTYCFIVLTSEDEGKKVSQTTSNAACVTPMYDVTFSLDTPISTSTAATDDTKFDMNGWFATCSATAGTGSTPGCPDPTVAASGSTTPFIAPDAGPENTGYHHADDPGPLYIEKGNGDTAAFVAGVNAGVLDLGFYSGFSDPTLPATAPLIKLDAKNYTVTDGANNQVTAPVINDDGYSIAGQSVPILAGHVYIIAVPDKSTTATPQTSGVNYHYMWMYVNAASQPGTQKVEMRIPANEAGEGT